MRKGDISNEVPPRIIVTLEAVSHRVLNEKKTWGGLRSEVEETFIWDMSTLSLLWDFSSRVGVTFELAHFGVTDEWLEDKWESLSRRGTNPFNYYVAYDSIEHLISELPFRNDVRNVVDLPSRIARFGSWGMELGYLERGR